MQSQDSFRGGIARQVERLGRWTVRQLAARKGLRRLLNRYYASLDADGRQRFQQRYARVFRSRGLLGNDGVALSPGEWEIRFAGRTIRLPLRPAWAWLDWDHAVSVIGDDVEVIQTYEALVGSDRPPTLFLDVGANFGTHSLLFLAAGVPSISFEPNPTCQALFHTLCEMNGVTGRWESVAVGNGSGQVELVYPEKEPWLGSVSSDIQSQLKGFDAVKTHLVPLRRLDDYVDALTGHHLLIKIDVEGSEPQVIEGATQLLRTCRPTLIFESYPFRDGVDVAGSRRTLFALLQERGYAIRALPLQQDASPLELGEFLESRGANFMAVAMGATPWPRAQGLHPARAR